MLEIFDTQNRQMEIFYFNIKESIYQRVCQF